MTQSKRVFITGTSAGFGFDTAKALAIAGHIVWATMRDAAGKNKAKADALISAAKGAPGSIRVLSLDVTDQPSIDAAVETAIAGGGIDVLINNAGVGSFGIDESFSVEQAQRLFDVNVFGVMRVNRAVLPHLREAKKGRIIYLSSGLGRIVLPFMAIYTASKFAVEGYAEATDIELAPLGIQTVIVQPGAFGTTFAPNSLMPSKDVTGEYGTTTQIFNAFAAGFEERFKTGAIGDPADVVKALVEEVERPTEECSLRRTVGREVQEPVGAINRTCAEVQSHLLKAFGVR